MQRILVSVAVALTAVACGSSPSPTELLKKFDHNSGLFCNPGRDSIQNVYGSQVQAYYNIADTDGNCSANESVSVDVYTNASAARHALVELRGGHSPDLAQWQDGRVTVEVPDTVGGADLSRIGQFLRSIDGMRQVLGPTG